MEKEVLGKTPKKKKPKTKKGGQKKQKKKKKRLNGQSALIRDPRLRPRRLWIQKNIN